MLLKSLLSCLALVLSLSSIGASQTLNQPGEFERALRTIKERNISELKTMLEKNPKLAKQKDARFGATLLHWAAVERDVEIIKVLLKNDASRAARNKENATPLMLAVVPNPNAKRDAKQNNIEVVNLLADEDVIELKNSVGKTALHLAAEYGDEEVVLTLLQKGASPTAKTVMMKEPWQYATNERIKKILHDKATTRAESLESSLYQYAKTGDLPRLKALLQQAGKKINLDSQQNANRETALIVAARNSHFEIVAYLIKMDADFTLKDGTGRNVWTYLCPQQVR